LNSNTTSKGFVGIIFGLAVSTASHAQLAPNWLSDTNYQKLASTASQLGCRPQLEAVGRTGMMTNPADRPLFNYVFNNIDFRGMPEKAMYLLVEKPFMRINEAQTKAARDSAIVKLKEVLATSAKSNGYAPGATQQMREFEAKAFQFHQCAIRAQFKDVDLASAGEVNSRAAQDRGQRVEDALYQAIKAHDVDEAERIMAANSSIVNYSDASCNAAQVRAKDLLEQFVGRTPARHVPVVVGWALRCAAAIDRNQDIIQYLIDKGANVNETSKDKRTPNFTSLDLAVAAQASGNAALIASKGGTANVSSTEQIQRVIGGAIPVLSGGAGRNSPSLTGAR